MRLFPCLGGRRAPPLALAALLLCAILPAGDAGAASPTPPPVPPPVSPGPTPGPVPDSGWVRLPLSRYEALLRDARGTPAQAAPPLEAGITSSAYVLTVRSRDEATLTTTLEAVASVDRRQRLPLPDLGAVYAAEVAAGAADVVGDHAAHLRMTRRGTTRVVLRSVPVRKEDSGRVTVRFGVPDAPANVLTAELPRGYGLVAVAGGSGRTTVGADGIVRVRATLVREAMVELTYAPAAAERSRDKLVATASESRLVRIGEEALSVAARVRVEVLRGTLDVLSVDAPEDLRLVAALADGSPVAAFERDPARPGRLLVRLGREVTSGAVDVFFVLARDLPPGAARGAGDVELPEIELVDVVRGETALAVVSRRPLVLDDAASRLEGWERIDESDLPAALAELLDEPVLLAARRIGTAPPRATLRLAAYPDAAHLAGIIDQARLLTVATADGRRVDRLRLDLQARQSILRLPLPEGAEVWSVVLDGKPVRPLTEKAEVLVALGRGARSLGTRRVEAVLASPGGLPERGKATLALPPLPFPATRVSWDVVLPETREARVGGGTVAPAPAPLEPVVPRPVAAATPAQVSSGLGFHDDVSTTGDASGATGTVHGKVADRSGALPGVTMTLWSAHGYRRQTTTDSYGTFRFMAVPPGQMRLSADLSGFTPEERSFTVSAGSVELRMTMQPAGVERAVTVTAVEEPPTSADPDAPPGTGGGAGEGERGGISLGLFGMKKKAESVSIAEAPAVEPPPPPAAPAPLLSDEERAALTRSSAAGVASIPVVLGEGGRRIHLEGSLLVGEAPQVELELRPRKRKR